MVKVITYANMWWKVIWYRWGWYWRSGQWWLHVL